MNNINWVCKKCQKRIRASYEIESDLRCETCSARLELGFSEGITWDTFNSKIHGILRYNDLIPVSQPNLVKVTDFENPEFTFPIESRKMAEFLGVESVHLLAPIYGPSGTFKDIEAAIVIAKCLDWSIKKRLSWHSTGNTARAYREYAIKCDLKSDSYFPLNCLDKFKGVAKNNENILIAYNGPFQEISSLAKKRAKENGSMHLAPLHWKIEGKAIIAYVVFENLPETNVVVQTIAGGYGILGFDLGVSRLKQLNLLQKTNLRYELFQIEGADTISQLMPLDREISETDLKLPVNPFERTLQSTNPLSTFNLVRKIIASTGSNINSVTKEDVIQYSKYFEKECWNLGINISYDDEKSPFISWAGLVIASKHKRLSKHDRIVIIITGAQKRLGKSPEVDILLKKTKG